MKKKTLIFASLAVFTIIVFIFIYHRNQPMNVAGYEVATTTYEEMISSMGTVEYEKEVHIKAEVSGTLIEMNGDVGDKLKKGVLVAKIEDSQAQTEYEESKTNKEINKARLKDYMETYSQNEKNVRDQRALQENEIAALKLEQAQLQTKIDETKTLVDAGALPSKELTSLQDKMAALELKVEAANRKLESLRSPVLAEQEYIASIEAADVKINKQKLLLEKYTVKAPMDGIVIERFVDPGTFVQAGEVLLKLASDSKKYAVVDMDEKYINYVAVGKEAIISTEAYPDETCKGIVESISPEVDKDSGTIRVKVKITEKTDRFLQNMSVKVEFVGKAYENAIVIPGEYLIDEEKSAIFIKGENGEAVKKELVILHKNAKNIMVLEGLTVGTVVLNPNDVREGTQVKVTSTKGSESDQ